MPDLVPYIEDDTAWPTMVTLAACLEAELRKSGLPPLCVCAPVPGPIAVMDRCGQCADTEGCGGQGWVRFVTEFPSKLFPQPDEGSGSCDSPMAYTLEVGIARCQPVGTTSAIGGFAAPTTEELVLATRQQMADLAAIKRAVNCCVSTLDVSYLLGAAIPMQATGDCGGIVWNVTIWSV